MKEIVRQFVIFGNFNSVTFESVLKLNDLREKYQLQVNAMPEIIEPPIDQPFKIQMTPPESRPVFQTANRKINVLFGTKRIHIEEVECESETYKVFNQMAIDIICEIVKSLELKVNRIAINGQLFCDNLETINKAFETLFNKSKLYSGNSEDWQCRVCSKEILPKLGCEINKIAQYVRGEFLDNVKKTQNGLIASYDYNTKNGIEKLFTESDIKVFNESAQKYRALFI